MSVRRDLEGNFKVGHSFASSVDLDMFSRIKRHPVFCHLSNSNKYGGHNVLNAESVSHIYGRASCYISNGQR